MKRKILRLAALFALLALLPAIASAANFAVVRGGQLNLREQATASSRSLGRYSTGSWVRIDGSAIGGWYSVTTMDGKRGYMNGSYLTLPSSTNACTVRYANGGYVNLRSGPSLDTSVIMRVTSGTTVYIQSSVGEWDYIWLSLSNGSTVYGYMHSSFLNRTTSTATVMTRNGGKVNVRSGPSMSYSSVGTLASGTQVSVLLKGNGWYFVTTGSLSGYMSTSYLSGSGSTVGSNTGSGSSGGGTTTSQIAYVNNPRSTQVLNLRESPSTSARSIGQYRNGTQVKVVTYGATWCEVYVGTRHGYMMTQYLSFTPVNQPAPQPPTQPQPPAPPQPPAQPPADQQPAPTAAPAPTSAPAPTAVPQPTMQVVPVATPEPTEQPLPGIVPMPTVWPSAGTIVTLSLLDGGSGKVNIYNDSALTELKASVDSGTQVTLLQYGESVCMILPGDNGVGYVQTYYVH